MRTSREAVEEQTQRAEALGRQRGDTRAELLETAVGRLAQACYLALGIGAYPYGVVEGAYLGDASLALLGAEGEQALELLALGALELLLGVEQ